MARTRVIAVVLCFNSWRRPRSESLGMVRRSIADHCADNVIPTKHVFSNGTAIGSLTDAATVLQNGTCAIEMATVFRWPMMRNQSCDGGATFAPNENVFTTNGMFSNGTAIGSLEWMSPRLLKWNVCNPNGDPSRLANVAKSNERWRGNVRSKRKCLLHEQHLLRWFDNAFARIPCSPFNTRGATSGVMVTKWTVADGQLFTSVKAEYNESCERRFPDRMSFGAASTEPCDEPDVLTSSRFTVVWDGMEFDCSEFFPMARTRVIAVVRQ